jgi:hypothetical protein
MRKGYKKILLILLIAGFLIAGYFLFNQDKLNSDKQVSIQNDVSYSQNQPETAQAPKLEETAEENYAEPSNEENPKSQNEPAQNIPEKFALEIPFYSQAPLSNWDPFHEDMCEEASVLNAALYLQGKKLTKDQFEAELQKMQRVEKKEIGEWKSTTVAEVKKLVEIYFEGTIESKIIRSPTISDIEAEIAASRPVVVPLAGRDIGNPNFTPPGPVYHMLVIKGYDSQNFVTNDVGTRKGNSYVYKKEVIMRNMHDWNKKDIRLGEKNVLVLYK